MDEREWNHGNSNWASIFTTNYRYLCNLHINFKEKKHYTYNDYYFRNHQQLRFYNLLQVMVKTWQLHWLTSKSLISQTKLFWEKLLKNCKVSSKNWKYPIKPILPSLEVTLPMLKIFLGLMFPFVFDSWVLAS